MSPRAARLEPRRAGPGVQASEVAPELPELGLGMTWGDINPPQTSTSPSSHPKYIHNPVFQLQDEPPAPTPSRSDRPPLSPSRLPLLGDLIWDMAFGWGFLSQPTPEVSGEPDPACEDTVVLMGSWSWGRAGKHLCPFPPLLLTDPLCPSFRGHRLPPSGGWKFLGSHPPSPTAPPWEPPCR